MKKAKKIMLVILVLILILSLCAVLFYNGILQLNNPSHKNYPVRGVDVSSYQGEIDWNALAQQQIDFAFIKATEGSSYTDIRFAHNWQNAQNTDLKFSAYHFFSYHSSGADQAKHFINTVPYLEGTLPPVVDIEFYAGVESTPFPAEDVVPEIRAMVEALEDYYGVKPILYFTQKSYELYIKGNFDDHPLWPRSVYGKLDYISSDGWEFWQYSNRKKLDGYHGTEQYIDMNCFNGSYNDFGNFYSTNCVKPK